MSASIFVSAIIAAGGRGQRFGHARPKQLLTVGGRAVLDRSVSAFADHPSVSEIIVALPPDMASDYPDYLRSASKRLQVVTGGARRQDSVAAAFAVIDPAADLVVIHDAARPFVTADLIARTIAAAAEAGAALAAVPARDTVKRASGAEGARHVASTLPRETIYLAQTPQAFRREVLRDALARNGDAEATDEAALVERAGGEVRLVDGDPSNIKITTPEDLPIAEAIARERDGRRPGGSSLRVGTGYDLHRLVEGRPLILGGVAIPFERGLTGHSDADAVCHAVTDAILGAAAYGDIGRLFPDTDPRWRGASSVDLLERVAALVRQRRCEPVNVDVVVIAEKPKLASHVDAMREALARALGIDVSCVSVKGKTNEGVGELGRGEAIAVHAVALCRVDE